MSTPPASRGPSTDGDPEIDCPDHAALATVTAFRLKAIGATDHARRIVPRSLPGIRALIGGPSTSCGDGLLHALSDGWQKFYDGRFAGAFKRFRHITSRSRQFWVTADAWLGLARVATVYGHLATANRLCIRTTALARDEEHMDILAKALGARNEVLLRAAGEGGDRARQRACGAAELASLNLALVPAGNCQRGRVYCYQAHAWARLGATDAAILAYRLGLHQAGEPATRHFALAGLAMLAMDDRHAPDFPRDGRIEEACADLEDGLTDNARSTHRQCASWALVCRAELHRARGERYDDDVRRACRLMPRSKPFRRLWLYHWSRAMGVDDAIDRPRPAEIDFSSLREDATPCSRFDESPAADGLPDEGYLLKTWGPDRETLLNQMRCFLP